jgi:hypothetical protein
MLEGRQTDAPEVNSYLDESAVRWRRLGVASAIHGVDGLATDIVPLIHTDIGDDGVGVTVTVRCRSKPVTHGRNTLEVCEAVRIGAGRIKGRNLARWSRHELVEEPIAEMR